MYKNWHSLYCVKLNIFLLIKLQSNVVTSSEVFSLFRCWLHERQTAGIWDCCHFRAAHMTIYCYTGVFFLSCLLSLRPELLCLEEDTCKDSILTQTSVYLTVKAYKEAKITWFQDSRAPWTLSLCVRASQTVLIEKRVLLKSLVFQPQCLKVCANDHSHIAQQYHMSV